MHSTVRMAIDTRLPLVMCVAFVERLLSCIAARNRSRSGNGMCA